MNVEEQIKRETKIKMGGSGIEKLGTKWRIEEPGGEKNETYKFVSKIVVQRYLWKCGFVKATGKSSKCKA